tara:strand:- start:76 stop:693 length:618 start_codon:yes stop_codon:yes gene_type:complete
MKEPSIQQLFATPIYLTELNRNFTKKENNLIFKIKNECIRNIGNTRSKDTYILNHKDFSTLKKELNLIINDYFNRIICPADKITPYITQSWLNYTTKDQYHHTHNHPNSLISGIIYMDADVKYDKIKFYNNHHYGIIAPSPKEYNNFNSAFWWFAVKTGQIILFPSALNHSVEAKKTNNTRVSLSFNVFIKGSIGSEDRLSTLTL